MRGYVFHLLRNSPHCPGRESERDRSQDTVGGSHQIQHGQRRGLRDDEKDDNGSPGLRVRPTLEPYQRRDQQE